MLMLSYLSTKTNTLSHTVTTENEMVEVQSWRQLLLVVDHGLLTYLHVSCDYFSCCYTGFVRYAKCWC